MWKLTVEPEPDSQELHFSVEVDPASQEGLEALCTVNRILTNLGYQPTPSVVLK